MRERETEGRKRLRNNKHDIMILYPVLEQTYSDIDSDGKAISIALVNVAGVMQHMVPG